MSGVLFASPHATHACQPLDSTCFYILKKEWDGCCDDMAQHPGKFISIYQFLSFCTEAWQNAKTVTANFKATGVYPWNHMAVDIPGAVNHKPIVTPIEKFARFQVIKYIPFYMSPYTEKENIPPLPEAEFSEKEVDLFAKR